MDFLPEQVRPIVERWFQRLQSRHGELVLPGPMAKKLFRLVAASDFAGNVLLREWAYFKDGLESLGRIPDATELQEFADDIAVGELPVDEVKSELRRYRNRYLLRLLACETERSVEVPRTLAALSLLADRLLAAATSYARVRLTDRFGEFRDSAGDPVPFVILGMGKLGGDELNFSSDIDLVFLFSEEGESDGPRRLSGQQYFTRLSQIIVALLDEVTADGFVFRIDTRLRPFGDSGPPVVSFAALETYLLQHGRDWERYAYIKAGIVGQRPAASISADLFDSIILPFVYRRYLDYGVFESLREMHAMIAAEVQRRDLADNVKLGPGGIREIEFIVQSLQLVRGGRHSELQQASLEAALPALADRRGLGDVGTRALWEAYVFLRRIENFIQAMRDQQTHDLPTDSVDRLRLCTAMGFADWEALLECLNTHRALVTAEFEKLAFRGGHRTDDADLAERFTVLWERGAGETEWLAALGEGPAAAGLAERIAAFSRSAARLRADGAAQGRLQRFVPTLLTLVLDSNDPVVALERTLAVIEQVLRRSAYLALLNENVVAAKRLVSLCTRSAYIAGQIARFPALLDELLDPARHSDRISRSEFERELESRIAHLGDADSEVQMEALAQFQRAGLFRVAVGDFGGEIPIMKVSDSLTYLAEVVLDRALEAALNDLVSKHGTPGYEIDGGFHEAGFGIIGYGKLGGLELSYGSDLDLVFLHDSHGSKQETNGEKPLDNAVFFARLVRRLLHFLTTQTSSGVMYEVDTRLRPDGRSGLLVTSTEAYERYQEDNAWTWEHQALLRARAVAGSASVAAEFDRIRRTTLINRVRRDRLHDDVVSMRHRMRRELDRSDGKHFDLKHGVGGISDIEFAVQYLVLRNAARYPAVIRYSDNIRQVATLASVGRLDIRTAARLQEVYRQFRLRLHHLSLNDRLPFVAASELQAEREFVVALWERHLAPGS